MRVSPMAIRTKMKPIPSPLMRSWMSSVSVMTASGPSAEAASSAGTRPDELGGRKIERPHGLGRSALGLDEDAAGQDVLPLAVEPDAFPRHDGIGLAEIGLDEGGTELLGSVDSARLMAAASGILAVEARAGV